MTGAGASAEAILLGWAAQADSHDGEPLAQLLTELAAAWGVSWLAVASAQRGKWSLVAEAGSGSGLPLDLLGDVLDQGILVEAAGSLAAPLSGGEVRSDVLVASGMTFEDSAQRDAFLQLLELLESARMTVRRRTRAVPNCSWRSCTHLRCCASSGANRSLRTRSGHWVRPRWLWWRVRVYPSDLQRLPLWLQRSRVDLRIPSGLRPPP